MIVYKFYKPNCAPCYNLGRILTTINTKDIVFVEKNVDVEENKLFAKQHGIDKVPALLLENGNFLQGNQSRDIVANFLKVE